MTDTTEAERDEEKKSHGIPKPAPHEEEAKGSPNDDRLQSEVPQPGDSKE